MTFAFDKYFQKVIIYFGFIPIRNFNPKSNLFLQSIFFIFKSYKKYGLNCYSYSYQTF